jgi:lipopolysaccharide transport system ATP-binding protein
MSNIIKIHAENLNLDLPVYGQKARSLRHSLFARTLKPKFLSPKSSGHTGGTIIHSPDGSSKIRALKSLSFDFQTGDRIGLIGPNGAGKSTLLLAISGIYEPTEGTLDVTGSTAGLFSLDQGMDPELSGRENIIIRTRFLGLPSKDVDHIMNDVEVFADLGEFLDMPIRTYSTGMLLRLAFAISTCTPSDILLMDEIVGVGDEGFMERAQTRLQNLISASGIVLLASHSEPIIRRWCNKALYLEKGECQEFGDVHSVIEAYKEKSRRERGR